MDGIRLLRFVKKSFRYTNMIDDVQRNVTDLVLFADNKEAKYHDKTKQRFDITLLDIAEQLRPYRSEIDIENLLNNILSMKQMNCSIDGKLGCAAVTTIRNVPLDLALNCKTLLENSDIASSYLQTAINKAANLNSEVATQIYCAEISNCCCSNKPSTFFEEVTSVVLFQTSAFNSNNCIDICRLVSQCIEIMKADAWQINGRCMLFGLSKNSKVSDLRLFDALTNDSSDENFSLWIEIFKQQLNNYPCMAQLFDASSETFKGNEEFYYIAITVGADLIQKASDVMIKLFRKLKVNVAKIEEIFVFPR